MRKSNRARIARGGVYAAGILACVSQPAQADWAQTLGISQRSTNLGNAVTATSDGYDAFYTNPAGAANFDKYKFGAGIKVMDVRTLNIKQKGVKKSGFTERNEPRPKPNLKRDLRNPLYAITHPIKTIRTIKDAAVNTVNEARDVLNFEKAVTRIDTLQERPAEGLDLSPERTLPNADVALVPSLGAYAPLQNWENVVIGLGIGTPFLVSAHYGKEDVEGNYGRFNSSSPGLVVTEVSPTVAVKVNKRLNVGASVGVTTFKYLNINSNLSGSNVKVNGNDVQLGSGSLGSYQLKSDDDIKLPGLEPTFATNSTDLSLTLGAQYKVTPKLSVGVTYRSKSPQTFEGTLNTTIDQIGVDTWLLDPESTYLGPFEFSDRFKYDMELPGHLQIGAAYSITPKWKVMADLRWTYWSDAKGFGTPSVIRLKEGNTDFGGATTAGSCSVGGLVKAALRLDQCNAVGTVLKSEGVESAGLKTITVNYNAEDTLSLHFGSSLKLSDRLEIQAGYIYDPSFMPDDSVDLITLSSNRHIFSLGGTYRTPLRDGELDVTVGGQIVYYEDRYIEIDESQNAGGINGLQLLVDNDTDPEFTSNSLGGFDIGGYVWSVGASVSYKFGGSNDPAETSDDGPLL